VSSLRGFSRPEAASKTAYGSASGRQLTPCTFLLYFSKTAYGSASGRQLTPYTFLLYFSKTADGVRLGKRPSAIMARARAAAAAPVSLRAVAVSLARCRAAVRRDFAELRHACIHTRPRQHPSSNRVTTTHQCLARLLASGLPALAIIGLNRAGVVDAVSIGCSLEKPHLFTFQIHAASSLPVQFLTPESIHESCLAIQTTSSLSRSLSPANFGVSKPPVISPPKQSILGGKPLRWELARFLEPVD